MIKMMMMVMKMMMLKMTMMKVLMDRRKEDNFLTRWSNFKGEEVRRI